MIEIIGGWILDFRDGTTLSYIKVSYHFVFTVDRARECFIFVVFIVVRADG